MREMYEVLGFLLVAVVLAKAVRFESPYFHLVIVLMAFVLWIGLRKYRRLPWDKF